jgi:Porin subfamily
VAGLPPGAKENAGSFQGLTNRHVFVDAAFVQWAGLTAGVAHSFFDFHTHN